MWYFGPKLLIYCKEKKIILGTAIINRLIGRMYRHTELFINKSKNEHDRPGLYGSLSKVSLCLI